MVTLGPVFMMIILKKASGIAAFFSLFSPNHIDGRLLKKTGPVTIQTRPCLSARDSQWRSSFFQIPLFWCWSCGQALSMVWVSMAACLLMRSAVDLGHRWPLTKRNDVLT